MTFFSKKSWVLGLVIFIPLLGAFFGAIVQKGILPALLPGVVLVFITWLWFGTKYSIKNGSLITLAGFIPYPKVNISDIIKIKPTNSFIAAPACSMDRILVQYSSSDYIIISPKRKKEFVERLKEINPSIDTSLMKF